MPKPPLPNAANRPLPPRGVAAPAVPAPVAAGSGRGWLTAAIALLVAAVTILAFAPSLHNQFLVWDDDVNFLNNPDFRGFSVHNLQWMFTSFHAGHYQPVTWLTLALDYTWGGMDPRAYHMTNIAIHALNSVLVYLLALRLLSWGLCRNGGSRTLAIHIAAATAALLFSIHPLRVENVAWITERRDLVSAMFLLLTILLYLRAVQADASRHWRWMFAAVAVSIVSLMSKVAGVPLAVILLGLDWFPVRRIGAVKDGLPGWFSRGARHIWLEKLLFLVPALGFAINASYWQSHRGWMYSQTLHPMWARISQSFYGLWFYLRKTAVPTDLLPLYELRFPMNPSEPRFAIAMIIVGAIAATAWMARRRAPALAIALLAYAALLGPVLGLFQNGPQIVADRYSYLPSVGLMIALTGGIAAWSMASPARKRVAAGFAVLGIGVIIVLIGQTRKQCAVWRTTESLWTATLAGDPDSAIANNGMGVVLHREHNKPADAVPYFQNATRIDSASKGIRLNLRNALRDAGRFDDLVAAWVDEAKFSIQFTGKATYDARFHAIEGGKAMDALQNDLALEHYTVSLALNPQQPQVENNLALVLGRVGRFDEAVAHYRRSIELDAKLPNPRYGLAKMLMQQGDNAGALAAIEEYLKLQPGEPNGVTIRDQLRATIAIPSSGR